MKPNKVLNKDCICLLQGKTKEAVIEELLGLLIRTGRIRDMEALKENLIYREGLMSTGIGLGIGIPHVRMEGVGDPLVVIGIQKEGIADYEALDKEPVRIVILIVVEKGQHQEHIKLLSVFTAHLKEKQIRERLYRAESVDAVYQCFQEPLNAG